MALFKKQDKKNEKEEKDLQAEKNADKISLDDELLGQGTAQNRKNAEQAAAVAALDVLKKRNKEKNT